MPFSLFLLVVLTTNGLFECVARIILLLSAIQSKYVNQKGLSGNSIESEREDLFISAHVAICNEPAAMVIDTLHAIASSRFDNFEVVVVDNNTSSSAVWRPVAEEMRKLGERFRFFHFDHLPGAKAGALNVALDKTDPRATHVAVVDADYQISPTFFADALSAVLSSGVDYVQFPQAYRGVSVCGRGVEQELGDYFACFASGAGRPGSMLPTGTLSLFSARALRGVGGWGARTITEDAELGVRLQAAGYRGIWRAEKTGRGLLPVDFRGLARQRARWAAGNMQVLLQVVAKRRMGLGSLDLVNLIGQLTAWISFWGLPAAALVAVALFPSLPLSGSIGLVAAGTIVFSTLLTGVRMAMLVERREGRRRIQLSAFAAKLALSWVSAFAWLPALVNVPLRFHRTPKVGDDQTPDRLIAMFVVSLWFAALATTFLLSERPLEAAACVVLSSVWACARWTDRCLRVTAALNAARV